MDTLDIETYTAELIATMDYLHDRQLKLILEMMISCGRQHLTISKIF